MPKIRVLKKENNSYIKLPQDLSSVDEIEFFQLRDGYYLVLAIRFENRTPPQVMNALSESEKIVLKELERKNLVNVFKGNKYKDGVYNIADSTYSQVYAKEGESKENAQTKSQQGQQPTQAKQQHTQPQAIYRPPPTPNLGQKFAVLNSQGFLIITDKLEAKDLSEAFSQQMKSGMVVGVKGFDGKFYVVTRDYLLKSQLAITATLKEPMDSDSDALSTQLDPEGC
ncbi:hypothetical protein HZC07_03245, partial [Candidatus Micrarchaeota archaeon]|nr:hypothetical protein [Candidatus Micrarchaeota archaeon]